MGVEPIKDVMDTAQLRLFGHVERREPEEHHLVQRVLSIDDPAPRSRRPKATWSNSCHKLMKEKRIPEQTVRDRR